MKVQSLINGRLNDLEGRAVEVKVGDVIEVPHGYGLALIADGNAVAVVSDPAPTEVQAEIPFSEAPEAEAPEVAPIAPTENKPRAGGRGRK
jgi:hypothetical protein